VRPAGEAVLSFLKVASKGYSVASNLVDRGVDVVGSALAALPVQDAVQDAQKVVIKVI
jgi:hypothetical protein